jgi:hypothetical protein
VLLFFSTLVSHIHRCVDVEKEVEAKKQGLYTAAECREGGGSRHEPDPTAFLDDRCDVSGSSHNIQAFLV